LSSSFFQERISQLKKRSEGEILVLKGDAGIEAAFHGRVGTWGKKLSEFNDRPLFDKFSGTYISIGPHGDYVGWLIQRGYIGILLYFVLMCSLIKSSIKTVRNISDYDYKVFGIMSCTSLICWVIAALIHNPSQYPDYMYFIMGSTAIFLSLGRKTKKVILNI
jgi:O-antigen ligase